VVSAWVPGGSPASAEARPPSVAAAERPALPRGGMCVGRKRPEHGNLRGQRNGIPEPNNPIFGVEMQFLCHIKSADMAETAENAPIRAAAAHGPPQKLVFWMLRSSPGSSESAATSHKTWDGSQTGCHNPAGRYNGIPRPLVCVAAGERRKR
jgi:hypothetical protein